MIHAYKAKLHNIYEETITLDLPDSDNIYLLQSKLEKLVFDCCLKVRRLLASNHTASNYTYSDPLPMPKPDNISSCNTIPLTGKSTPSDPDKSSTIATFSALEISTFLTSHGSKTCASIDFLHSSTDPSFVDQTETELSTQTIGVVPNLLPCSLMKQSIDCHTVRSQVWDPTANVSLSSKCSTQYLHLPTIACHDAELSHTTDSDSSPQAHASSVIMSFECELPSREFTTLALPRVTYISLCSFIQMQLLSPQIVSYLIPYSYICHSQWYLIPYMYMIANSNLCIIHSLSPSHVTWTHRCLLNWTLNSLVMNIELIEIGLC